MTATGTMRLFSKNGSKIVYKGRAKIDDRVGLDFDLTVVRGQQFSTVRLELDEYECEDFDAGRKRMALWLRSIAEVLDGESELIPLVIRKKETAPVEETQNSKEWLRDEIRGMFANLDWPSRTGQAGLAKPSEDGLTPEDQSGPEEVESEPLAEEPN